MTTIPSEMLQGDHFLGRRGGVKLAASRAGTLPGSEECETIGMDEGSETGWSDNCGTISPKNFEHLHTQTLIQSPRVVSG